MCKLLSVCYRKKVSEGVGHPNNKTSFVGFVFLRMGGSTPVPVLVYYMAGRRGGGIIKQAGEGARERVRGTKGV